MRLNGFEWWIVLLSVFFMLSLVKLKVNLLAGSYLGVPTYIHMLAKRAGQMSHRITNA